MSSIKQYSSPRATLIGDVVGSRRATDRPGLHRVLASALRHATGGAIDPPAFTVGDEFQGSYPTVGAAIDAALGLRLAVGPQVDVRFGIGWGGSPSSTPTLESGRTRLVDRARGHPADRSRSTAARLRADPHDLPGGRRHTR